MLTLLWLNFKHKDRVLGLIVGADSRSVGMSVVKYCGEKGE